MNPPILVIGLPDELSAVKYILSPFDWYSLKLHEVSSEANSANNMTGPMLLYIKFFIVASRLHDNPSRQFGMHVKFSPVLSDCQCKMTWRVANRYCQAVGCYDAVEAHKPPVDRPG